MQRNFQTKKARKAFITYSIVTSVFMILSLIYCNIVVADKHKKDPSPLEELPGKIEQYSHPSGKLEVNFITLTKDYNTPNKTLLPKGLTIGEIEQEGMRSVPFSMGTKKQNLMIAFKKAIKDNNSDINSVPIMLIQYRILRPEHIELLNDPKKNDVLTPEGIDKLRRLKEPWKATSEKEGKGASTDVLIQKREELTNNNCIYAVYKGIPLIEGMHLDLQVRENKKKLYKIAKKHGLTYSELSPIQLTAQNHRLDSQGKFYKEKADKLKQEALKLLSK